MIGSVHDQLNIEHIHSNKRVSRASHAIKKSFSFLLGPLLVEKSVVSLIKLYPECASASCYELVDLLRGSKFGTFDYQFFQIINNIDHTYHSLF